ncbi:restriction endonuclease subunit S [Acinetobacter sp. YH16040_T]|uniref:restriction endonuclease subunit S n=1 Tax=unclassified Acinetobacter TaxID=196816 RepID=UPI00214840EC|nr:restriction endonuclease subunit S [Acinetobacter sp. YH16040_T]UUS56991.1 restriction endonuclease subunit S [Acinetobacter sp. YH16040_T]
MSLEYQKLGDVADFIRGITYKPNDLVENFSEGSTVCMRTANVQVQLKQDDLLSVPVNLVKNEDKFLIEGDILVSTANSWNLVGKCCWIPKLEYSATAGGFISILRANQEKLDQRYLYHWFNSPNTQLLARNCGRQTTNISNMDLERCLSIKIPLPPLAEQRRIASILDQADELRQKRQQAIEKLDQLLQATFIDMFGDPVSNPKGWEVLKWGDALKIINGKNQKAVLDQNGTFPICGSGGVMGYANEWLTPAQSVIIGRKGNINKPILMFENFWNVDTAFGLVPNKDLLKVDYLFWFCHFFNFEQLNKTVTIPSLTKSDLLNIKIPIPPLEKQLYFSNICDQTRKLKSKMELKDLNLFSSLQNQAFSGTL